MSRLSPAAGSRFGYIHIPEGSRKKAKRNLSLAARLAAMLKAYTPDASGFVFPGKKASFPGIITRSTSTMSSAVC